MLAGAQSRCRWPAYLGPDGQAPESERCRIRAATQLIDQQHPDGLARERERPQHVQRLGAGQGGLQRPPGGRPLAQPQVSPDLEEVSADEMAEIERRMRLMGYM